MTTPRVPKSTTAAVRSLLLWATIATQDKVDRDHAELRAESDACAHLAAYHANNLRVSRRAEHDARTKLAARGIDTLL